MGGCTADAMVEFSTNLWDNSTHDGTRQFKINARSQGATQLARATQGKAWA